MRFLFKNVISLVLIVGSMSAMAVTEKTLTANSLTRDPSSFLSGTFNNASDASAYSGIYNRAFFTSHGDASDGYKFQDTFNFNLTSPLDGFARLDSSWLVQSWSATLNGVALASVASSPYAGALAGTASFVSGLNTLVIAGVAGSPGAPSWGDGTAGYNLTLGGNVPAVPEPETFAMLLAGLGLIGMATKRRDRNTKRQA